MQPGTNRLFFGKDQAVPSGVRLNFTGNVTLQASAKALPLFRAFNKCFFVEPGPQSSPSGELACRAWSIDACGSGPYSMVMEQKEILIPFQANGRVRMADGKLRKTSESLFITANVPFFTVNQEFMEEIAGAKPQQTAGKLQCDKRRLPEDVFLTREFTETESALKQKVNEAKNM